jgi:polyisoprenoid-binding protein YceI
MQKGVIRCMTLYVLLFLIAVGAFCQEKTVVYFCRNGSVNFLSDAPLEMIKASNNNLTGVISITDRSFSFQIPTKSFEGFNSALQKVHFNEDYMETELYPNSTFKGRIIEEVDLTVPGTYQVRAKGKLTIHGVEIDRIVRCDLTVSKDKIDAKANFSVLIADHNISVPSILNQKIASEVKVTVTLAFLRSDK